jgi:hypothetical protein
MSSVPKSGIKAVAGKAAGYFKEIDLIPDNYQLCTDLYELIIYYVNKK